MWKKILYIGLIVIIGIMVYIMGYSSNQYNHIFELTNTAIEEKKYSDVAKIFGGCFDTKTIVTDNSDQLDLVIYPGTSQVDVVYTANDKEESFLEYERAYYLYIFDVKFGYSTITSGESTITNDLGIKFSNGNKDFLYRLVVNSSVNKDLYKSAPTSLEEALLNNSRDSSQTYKDWKFMTVTFTESMMKNIVANIGGDITQISVVDNSNSSVYTTDIKLDFSQDFFIDTKPLVDAYNEYLDSFASANGDKTKQNEAVEKFNNFYNPWLADFEANSATTGYSFRYDDKFLSPTKLVWQTIGNEAIFLVVAILFYFIIFHFGALRRLFTKETHKEYGKSTTSAKKPTTLNKYKNKQGVIYIPKDEDKKPEVVEEKEENNAANVVEEPVSVVEETPVEVAKEETIEAETVTESNEETQKNQ